MIRLGRDHRGFTLSTSSQQIAGPNGKRFGLVIGSPTPTDTPFISDGTLTSGASTATTGVKSSYVVPAGVQATLLSATMFGTTGTTQVAALQIVRAATTFNLAQFTGSGTFALAIPLQAGDTVQWNCTTAIAASVTDFTINVNRERSPTRVTIEFAKPAVLDLGITIYPNTAPLILLAEHVGQGIREEINAIASAGTPSIGVMDIAFL